MPELLMLPEINSALVHYEKQYATLCHRIEQPNKTYENRTSYAFIWACRTLGRTVPA